MAELKNGSIVKFKGDAKVYLVDNGKLRHFTKEVKTKSGKSIFNFMVELDPSYKEGYTEGAKISGDIPFDPVSPGWEAALPKVVVKEEAPVKKDVVKPVEETPPATPGKRNFYKKGGSYYYVDNNEKILNEKDLAEASKYGVEVPEPTVKEEEKKADGGVMNIDSLANKESDLTKEEANWLEEFFGQPKDEYWKIKQQGSNFWAGKVGSAKNLVEWLKSGSVGIPEDSPYKQGLTELPAKVEGDKPDVVAPNGQVISKDDPNYDDYVDQGAEPVKEGDPGYVAPTGLPAYILDDPAYQGLSDEWKKIIELNYLGQSEKTAEGKEKAANALVAALGVVSPYTAEAIKLAQEELTQSISGVEYDAQTGADKLNKKITDIEKNLQYNKGELSLDETADLVKLKANYESELYGLQQGMAESGLAFSSPRAKAEKLLSEENQGIVTSTQRKYAQAQYGLQEQSDIQTAANQKLLLDIEQNKQENLKKLGLAGESVLGTKNLPGGAESIGGIVGDIPYKKGEMVTNLQNKLSKDYLNL